jgi:hypothetical protein
MLLLLIPRLEMIFALSEYRRVPVPIHKLTVF